MLQTWGYVSLDPAATRRRVGTVLRRHELSVQGDAAGFRASLETLGDEQLSVTRLSYGAAVIVEPVPEPGFWVLSLPLQGRVQVAADSGRVDSRPGVASLLPSSGKVRGHWLRGSRQAVLRIREDLLWNACAGISDHPDQFLRDASPVLPVGPHTGLLVGVMQTLASLDFQQYIALPAQGSALQWAALAQLLAGAVVSARLPGQSREPATGGGAFKLRRVQALMRDMVEAEEAVTVGALARRAGCSLRALQVLFQAHAGMTVVQAIREVKLLRAQTLLNAGHTSVADVALACGFQHQGRFAAMYAQRFGKLPSHENAASAAIGRRRMAPYASHVNGPLKR